MNKRLYKVTLFVHKWAGLILALQLLAWIGGGVVMSVIPLEMVHGKHLASATKETPNTSFDFSLDELRSGLQGTVKSIEFISVAGNPVYRVTTNNGLQFFNADTGQTITPLTESQIQAFAKSYYLGDSEISQTSYLTEPPPEASGVRDPVWQINFDDWVDTSLYLSPLSGELLKTRSDLWRLFDFVWMLHIMDYDEREDFNNPLLRIFAVAAFLFTLTGIVLLVKVYWPRARSRA